MDGLGRRERKKLEVRERICLEAKRLLAREDAADVSIERIAEAADVSRATFFNYFATKNALLDALSLSLTEKLRAHLEQLRTRGAPLDETLLEWFEFSVRSIRRSEALSRVLFARAFSGSEASTMRAEQMAEVHRAYAGLVSEARARGEVATDVDVEFVAEMIAGAMTMLLNNWINDSRYPLEARAVETARFLSAAIARGESKGRNR